MSAEVAGKILVVDDQPNLRLTTALMLRRTGYTVLEARDAEDALHIMSTDPVDLVVTDLRMEPLDGLTLLERTMEVCPLANVIVMTAYGTIDGAVEAIRKGAYDYLSKPFSEGELLDRVRRALGHRKMITSAQQLDEGFRARHGLSSILGRSAVMLQLTAKLTRVAPSDATVLIIGESGTGKELVAQALHVHSRRRERPFIAVNCAAISESLLESELFGHARGAFTGAVKARRGLFEEADGGTLFIDEVTETSSQFQTKLLRVLQEGEVRRVGESTSIKVDVRIVAASNRDVLREVREGRFRQDLYYRLNVVSLNVPPLRERLEDVPLLARHFLARANARNNTHRLLSMAALGHLCRHAFPGNVRELENLVEQAAALAENVELRPEDFPVFSEAPSTQARKREGARGETLEQSVLRAEREAIVASLERHQGNVVNVARELAVSHTPGAGAFFRNEIATFQY
jgi:two-component system response regulator HydG